MQSSWCSPTNFYIWNRHYNTKFRDLNSSFDPTSEVHQIIVLMLSYRCCNLGCMNTWNFLFSEI